MTKLRTGLIILNYNDYENTIALINLTRQMKIISKIIIVDNCSSDDSYIKLNKYKNEKIEILKTDNNLGYAYGNNFGVKYALEKYDIEYIIIANPDVHFEENVIKNMLQQLEKNDKAAQIAPIMTSPNGRKENTAWKLPTYFDNLQSIFIPIRKLRSKNYLKDIDSKEQKIKIVDVLSGDFFMIKSRIFQDVGFFDESTFLYGEEDILAFKIRNFGFMNMLLLTDTYIHLQEGTISKNITSQEKKFQYLFDSTRIYNNKYLKCNLLQRILYFTLWHVAKIIRKIINLFR